MGRLSAARIRAELNRRGEKTRKVSDGQGLYIEIPPKGSGRWRYKYRINNREKRISLGVYPDVTLKQAREKHQEMKRLHANGIDPSAKRQSEKILSENTFEAVAREWFARQKTIWTEKHAATVIGRLESKVFPYLGKNAVETMTAVEILVVLRKIESQEKYETAHRVLSICGQVLRYAVATGRATGDVTSALRGALTPTKAKHLPAIIDPKRFAQLLVSIDGYAGQITTKWALQLAPLVFVRPGELRQAEWTEVDFEKERWTIPAAKMKTSRDHIVPLSKQALAIFAEVRLLNGTHKYVFPSVRGKDRPMSDMTLNAALRRLGYKNEEVSMHGFRASARTLLDEELRQRPDLIEHQLAHAVRGPLGRAYNRTQFLEERKGMMQVWADYLDDIKAKA